MAVLGVALGVVGQSFEPRGEIGKPIGKPDDPEDEPERDQGDSENAAAGEEGQLDRGSFRGHGDTVAGSRDGVTSA
jgi:hypothetical protein